MKNTSRTLLFAFGLSLFLLISQASCGKLYQEVCSKVGPVNKAKCLQLMKSDPKIASAKGYLQLSKATLQMAIKRATDAQNYLKSLMNSNPASKAIKDCATIHYNLVVNSFKSSLGELIEDPQTANYDARVSSDGPATCNRALASENINNPTIANLNSEMSLLSDMTYLATNGITSSKE